ncbi:hypothetical protein [Streptomyces sp. NPDC001401]
MSAGKEGGTDDARRQEAVETATLALEARSRLWAGITQARG